MNFRAVVPVAMLTLSMGAWAQAERELNTLYGYGRFEQVEAVAKEAIAREKARSKPDRAVLIELHKYAGAASFNLGHTRDAEQQFLALLELDPDFALDPFVYPPGAVSFVEALKKREAARLEPLRAREREAAAERDRQAKEADRRIREAREAEEARRRMADLTGGVTLRTVERRSFALNFLPFGAGQFQQDRTNVGIGLAVLEGALGATSVIAYFALESEIREQAIPNDNQVLDTQEYIRGIPADRKRYADTWRLVKLGSGVAFYAAWGLGVVDALLHHQDQVTTTTVVSPTSSVVPVISPTGESFSAGVRLSF